MSTKTTILAIALVAGAGALFATKPSPADVDRKVDDMIRSQITNAKPGGDNLVENLRIGQTGFAFILNKSGRFQTSANAEGTAAVEAREGQGGLYRVRRFESRKMARVAAQGRLARYLYLVDLAT